MDKKKHPNALKKTFLKQSSFEQILDHCINRLDTLSSEYNELTM